MLICAHPLFKTRTLYDGNYKIFQTKGRVALVDKIVFVGIKFSVKFLFPVEFKMACVGRT